MRQALGMAMWLALAACGGERPLSKVGCQEASDCASTERCVSGRCERPPRGPVPTVDPCVDVRCGDGEACLAGVCQALCSAGKTSCQDACVDTATSREHCGGCGRACALPHAVPGCAAGGCVVVSCAVGYDDCDGQAANGCERDLLADTHNCGRCGNVCPWAPAGQISSCEEGVCRTRCGPGLVLCGGSCQASCEDWRWTNPVTSPNNLYAVDFSDATHGLAGGDHTLLRTTDGLAWTAQSSSPLDHLEALHFTSSSHVVAVGFDLTSPQTGGLRSYAVTSDDAGLSWVKRAVPIGTSDQLMDLAMDGATGVAVGMSGSGGSVFVTTDGGESWVERTPADVKTAPKGKLTWLHGVHLRGQKLWVVGDEGTVRLSGDLGRTWTAPATPPTGGLRGVQFADDRNGLVVGYGEAIWRTTDGGATFAQVHGGPASTWLRRVQYSDPRHAVAMGFNGTTLRSADGGATWAGSNPYLFSYFFSMAVQGKSLWAVGTRGVIFRSDDSGATFSRQTPGYTASLARAAFPEEKIGYAVGEIGGILKTTDGGRSWGVSLGQHDPYVRANPLMGMLGNCLRGVHFVTRDLGWAVGDAVMRDQQTAAGDAVILNTRDGGATWTEQRSGTAAGLKAVSFSSAQKGFAVGSGVILRTVDGGATWTQVPGSFTTLTDVTAISDSEAWVSGYQVLLHTVDGGLTWTRVNKPLGILWSVRFSDALHGMATGWGLNLQGAIELTEDGGRTWTSVTVPGTDGVWATALAKDGRNAVATTGGGRILRSTDGGKSWTVDANPTFLLLSDVRAADGGFVIVTEMGGILRGPLSAPVHP